MPAIRPSLFARGIATRMGRNAACSGLARSAAATPHAPASSKKLSHGSISAAVQTQQTLMTHLSPGVSTIAVRIHRGPCAVADPSGSIATGIRRSLDVSNSAQPSPRNGRSFVISSFTVTIHTDKRDSSAKNTGLRGLSRNARQARLRRGIGDRDFGRKGDSETYS
jgi:hypothetical protein